MSEQEATGGIYLIALTLNEFNHINKLLDKEYKHRLYVREKYWKNKSQNNNIRQGEGRTIGPSKLEVLCIIHDPFPSKIDIDAIKLSEKCIKT